MTASFPKGIGQEKAFVLTAAFGISLTEVRRAVDPKLRSEGRTA